MTRLAILLCLAVCCGCSSETPQNAGAKKATEVEDGGGPADPDRDKAEAYFTALKNVKSAEEEEKLLTEFGEWLKKNEYQIQVEEKDGKHTLACPFFPPVTPWTEHSFFDLKNLKLLPLLEEDETVS